MKYVEVVTDAASTDTVSAIAEKQEAADFRVGVIGEDGMQAMRLLAADDKIQSVIECTGRRHGCCRIAAASRHTGTYAG